MACHANANCGRWVLVHLHAAGVLDCAKKTVQWEGLGGLYKVGMHGRARQGLHVATRSRTHVTTAVLGHG